MMDHALRKMKDDLLLPVACQVGKSVSPTVITLTAAVVGVSAAVAASQGAHGLGLTLWLVNRVLDGLDGAVARATGQQSDFGGLCDTMVDFLLYAFIPLGLVLGAPTMDNLIAFGVMLASFYVNAGTFLYLSAILERRSVGAKARGELTTIHMPRGIIEGAETILFYCAFFLFPDALFWLFTLMAVLVFATAARHLAWAARQLR